MTPKTVLITGAASGIAFQAALELAARGHQVVATARHLEDLDKLKAAANKQKLGLDYQALDITDPEAAKQLASKYTIDVLINSAASGETGPIAELPLERVRANFETNVFGTLAVIQAFVPQMIARRSGRIVVMSSMAGLTTPMFFNPYSGTKAAIESISASLRNELKYFNVEVAVVVPGRIDGGHNARIAATKYDWLKSDSPYYPLIDEMKQHDRMLLDNAYPIKPVVRDIVKAVEDKKPRVHYATPSKYRLGLLMLRLMPSRMQDWLFFKADRLLLFK
jgi:short-subunit dehydrogenase